MKIFAPKVFLFFRPAAPAIDPFFRFTNRHQKPVQSHARPPFLHWRPPQKCTKKVQGKTPRKPSQIRPEIVMHLRYSESLEWMTESPSDAKNRALHRVAPACICSMSFLFKLP
ncbi:MAG: hypothetical protein A2W64_00710 [Candidatus Zambryskibacteria bacterium RIFCSPLOWO2_02_39_10]|nr:MAG: hypothetical protein A2W64_00710 [Candidatus Zambryskibacteria bacterium RIFCSPLOWO2_02_39_10]